MNLREFEDILKKKKYKKVKDYSSKENMLYRKDNNAVTDIQVCLVDRGDGLHWLYKKLYADKDLIIGCMELDINLSGYIENIKQADLVVLIS